MGLMHPTDLSLVDLARLLVRRWRLSGGVFLSCIAITFLALWLLPRTYRSESKLYIRVGRESASLDPTAVVGRTTLGQPALNTRENELNSVTEILQSRVLLERVVESIGPEVIMLGVDPVDGMLNDPALAPTIANAPQTASLAPVDWTAGPTASDRAILRLQNMVQVLPVKKSDVVRLTCDARSPRLAQAILTRLVDGYLAEHLRLNRTSGAVRVPGTSDRRDARQARTGRGRPAVAQRQDRPGLVRHAARAARDAGRSPGRGVASHERSLPAPRRRPNCCAASLRRCPKPPSPPAPPTFRTMARN